MRKTSQDGGDSTSITSGIENEIKKPGAIKKNKRNSIKRKVQNFNHESDDAVIEPLLQKDTEKADTSKQSVKHNMLSKAKTETNSQTGSDTDKLIPDYKLQNAALSNASDITDNMLPASSMKDNSISKFTSANAPLHNHMNTNVFSSHGSSKGVAAKSQILVEIDVSKQVGYSPSPLIFTTAKIHTDGKTKHMEPVQVTPVPILSTIEVSVMKNGINKSEFSGPVSSSISTICTNISNIDTNITEQDKNPLFKMPNNTPRNEFADSKISDKSDKSFNLSNNNVTIDVLQTKCMETKEGCPTKGVTVTVPLSVNKTTSENHYTKDSGVLTQTVATTQVKTYTPKYQEMKMYLNKNIMQDSPDFQRSKPPDNVKLQSDAENPLDKTSKDNDNGISNTSIQLRAKNIVMKNDNPISELNPNIVSSSLSNDTKGLKKSVEFQKSSLILGNILSDTKLPMSSANSVPVFSAATLAITTSLVDSKNAITTSEAKINANRSIGKTVVPITTTEADKKTSTVSVSTAKVLTTISAAGQTKSASVTKSTDAIKITYPSTTVVDDNKTLTSLSSIAAANKKFTPMTTVAVTNKVSAPTSTFTVKKSTSNFISPVSSTTNSTTPSNTIKPVIVTTTTGVESSKTRTTSTRTLSQVTSTISNNKPSTSTMSSKSIKASKVPTAITSFQPTTLVKSPLVTTAKSHNTKSITTTVAISTDNSLKSSTSISKPSSFKNNSNNSAADTTTSLTLASSGSSSQSAAVNQNESKSGEKNNAKKSS